MEKVGIRGWMSRDGRVSNERERVEQENRRQAQYLGLPSAAAQVDAYAVGWC